MFPIISPIMPNISMKPPPWKNKWHKVLFYSGFELRCVKAKHEKSKNKLQFNDYHLLVELKQKESLSAMR